MNVEEDAGWLQSLSACYRLLSIVVRCPDSSVAQGVRSGSISEDIAVLSRELSWSEPARARMLDDLRESAACGGESDDVTLSSLRREFTRMFENPEHRVTYLYEGAFRFSLKEAGISGTFFGSSAARDALRHYRSAGLEMRYVDSADHIGTEAEFVSFVLDKLAAAVSAGESNEKRLWATRLEAFLSEHWDTWYADFFRCVRDETRSPFYRAVAAMGLEAGSSLFALRAVIRSSYGTEQVA